MKKSILYIFLMGITLNAWEINTHRAIDRTAIAYSANLQTFAQDTDIGSGDYRNEHFDGYGTSYFNYRAPLKIHPKTPTPLKTPSAILQKPT